MDKTTFEINLLDSSFEDLRRLRDIHRIPFLLQINEVGFETDSIEPSGIIQRRRSSRIFINPKKEDFIRYKLLITIQVMGSAIAEIIVRKQDEELVRLCL